MGAKSEEEKAYLTALMLASREGHLCLDLSTSDERVRTGAERFSSPYVHRFESLCYLKRNWVYESRILEHVRRLLGEGPPLFYYSEELNRQQQEAVVSALGHNLSIITGGPGTGKTFIAKHLVKAMGPNARVFLAAPTGKAAARLQQANPSVSCGTVHALLGIRSERDFLREGSFISSDLIIVDECSMIDVKLLSYFLASVHHGTKVVLMGDSDQLPPVESGSVFADLIDIVPTARLTDSLRSDRKEILDLAAAVKEGKWSGAIFPLKEIWSEIAGQSWEKTRILSCVREGPWGVNTLNQAIFDEMKGQGRPVPIMVTRTDYDLGLYNGETGWLEGKEAFFPEKEKIALASLSAYEYAYCLSVHKSQGSEFDSVLLAVPPGSEVFGREMLYTAATRAKNSIKIFSDAETIQKTLQRISRKISGLRARFKK